MVQDFHPIPKRPKNQIIMKMPEKRHNNIPYGNCDKHNCNYIVCSCCAIHDKRNYKLWKKQNIGIMDYKKIAKLLKSLASELTQDDYEVSELDILHHLEYQCTSGEEAGEIKQAIQDIN